MRQLAIRLAGIRGDIINRQPFFGQLLMRLPFGFEACETAYTDMHKIVFDPGFASALDDRQLRVVLMHECMHCALKHCTRGSGKLPVIYNLACDIVVNSIILDAMGCDDIEIDGTNALHLAPNGKEGKLYSAEEIYKMILQESEKMLNNLLENGSFDKHGAWKSVFSDSVLETQWNSYITDAAQKSAGNIPGGLQRHVNAVCKTPEISWRQVLHDFIHCDRADYVFSNPDRRFADDIIMPAFTENVDGAAAENIWFAVDTSGSVSDSTLSVVMGELKSASQQIGLRGYISFFDCDITPPVPFENTEQTDSITPVGGGGTSFRVVFDSIDSFFEDLPRAIVVMTDGYAEFPDEKAAKGIPVLWIITDSNKKPPWGGYTKIYTD